MAAVARADPDSDGQRSATDAAVASEIGAVGDATARPIGPEVAREVLHATVTPAVVCPGCGVTLLLSGLPTVTKVPESAS